jgi:acyl-CoA reductase-like NAD-dependent aldehyde dehydrogenase
MVRQSDPIWLHRDPCNGSQVLFEVALHRQVGVARTMESLKQAQASWERCPSSERLSRLREWVAALEQNQDAWVARLVRDVAKPVADARAEVRYGLDLVRNLHAELETDNPSRSFLVNYRPHGLVGLVTPWNNPFAIPVSKIAAALVFGNSVAWKPALPATAISKALHDALLEADLGQHVGLITGDGQTGQILVRHRDLAAVSFTGSIAVGRTIAHACGRLLRPCQLEMGGNNGAIVLADADIPGAAADLSSAMFSFSGQRCTAIRRVIVEERIFSAFSKSFRQAVRGLVIGLPSDDATQVGPVISKESRNRLNRAVRQALKEGARDIAEVKLPRQLGEGGSWVAPSVLTDLSGESAIVMEEQFGPVVALMSARNLDDALRQHNAVEHGLLGALYSTSKSSRHHFMEYAGAGMLVLNQARPRFESAAPFVGWKASGFGPPEHGRWDRDFYAKVQAVYL